MAESKPIRIPLVGNMNQRGIDGFQSLVTLGKDQRFSGVFFNIVNNPVTRQAIVYAEKRPGLVSEATIESGSNGQAISDDHLVTIFNNAGTYTAYYNDSISCGTFDTNNVPVWIRKVRLNNEVHYAISGNSGGFGYYIPVAATSIALTFTGDTHTNTTIDNISSMSGLYVGQLITGTGIDTNTRIATINVSGSSITTTVATTATAAGVTITRTHMGKIVDADFPSVATGPFVDLNGRLYVADTNGIIWGSELNSITSWTSTNRITAGIRPDTGIGVFKHANLIGYFGSLHVEYFRDAGNPSGSQLKSTGVYSEIGNAGSALDFGDLLTEAGDTLITEASDTLITEGSFANVRSFYYLEDDIFFFGVVGAQKGIWKISELKPVKISGPSQDYIITSSGSVQSIEPFGAPSGTYLQVRNGASYSLLYHKETGIWQESGLPAGYMVSHDGHLLSNNGTTGKRYRFDFGQSNVFTDDGSSYEFTIQTSRRDYGTGNRKFVEYYELDSDQTTGTATLEVSDDDFQNWTEIGTFDLTQNHPRIHFGGSFEGGRAERIKSSSNGAFRASILSVKLEAGTH